MSAANFQAGDREVLIVDDDPEIRRSMQELFAREGIYCPSAVATGKLAIATALERRPAAIILDIELADDVDGVSVAQRLAGKPQSLIVYVSGTSSRSVIDQAHATCPLAFLKKPIQEKQLLALVHGAFRYRECLRAGEAGDHPEIDLITICAWCRRVRAPGPQWTPLAEFLMDAPVRRFTHGICRECMQREMETVKRAGMRNKPQANIRAATD